MSSSLRNLKKLTRTVSDHETLLAVILDQITQGAVLLDDAIIGLADIDSVSNVATLIAIKADVDGDIVIHALDTQTEEPLTLLCRAAGLHINGFSAVLRMRRRRRGSDTSPPEALAAFLRMPVEAAWRASRALQVT